MTRPVAILTSDWHLSHVAPTARSCEDWYAVQKRYLDQLIELQKRFGDVPIVVAGDVFHSWRSEQSPSELLNFLLHNFPPHVYAIPGQHDLPDHRYEAIHRTPFELLSRAGLITEIQPGVPTRTHTGVMLYGFPWGFSVTPLEAARDQRAVWIESNITVAVVHAFIWQGENKYTGAPVNQNIGFYRDALEGYDAAVFGDNHQGFISPDGKIINTGTLMRRRLDERDYKPMVGILFNDGHIEIEYLDVSQDRWLEGRTQDLPGVIAADSCDTSSFLSSLQSLGADSLDFREAIRRKLASEPTTDEVRSIVLEAVG